MLFNRDEARATAASSALSKILQGGVKPVIKARQGSVFGTRNNLLPAGDVDELLVYHTRNQDTMQGEGDVKYDRKVWRQHETGASGWKEQHRRGADEASPGEGEEKVEVLKARGNLYSSSKEVESTNTGSDMKLDGEDGIDNLLPHGIRGMEDFGKWSPRWKVREDFDNEGIEEVAWGFNNLGV